MLLLALVAAACRWAAGASLLELGDGTVQLQGFRTNGSTRSAGGRELEWELAGQSASMQPPIFQLSGVLLRMQSPNGRYIVSSPHCTFDQLKHELRSDAAVKVSGPGVEVTGIGYDFYWDGHDGKPVLVIRKAAHIEIEAGAVRNAKDLKP